MAATIASLLVDVAANTASLERGVKDVQSSLDSMAGFAVKAGKAIASAFVVTEVIQAARQFVELAGSLEDMSAKTGIGIEMLQKLKYAAEQNGGSIDTVTNSITKMGKGLAEGDRGVINALGKLGLSFEDVRRMDPGEAFLAIGDAIGKVHDPMAQAALATTIFGKAGAENLPMFNGHLKETADAAEQMGLVLSKDVVAAGDQFGDTLSTLLTAGMALLGKVIGPFLPLLQQLANGALIVANALGVVLGDAINLIVGVGKKAIDWIVTMATKVLAFAERVPGVSSIVHGMSAAFEGVRDAASWVHTKIGELNPTIDKSTDALKKHGPAVLDVTNLHGGAAKAVKEHTVATAEQVQVEELWRKAKAHDAAALAFETTQWESAEKAMVSYIQHLPHSTMGLAGPQMIAPKIIGDSEAVNQAIVDAYTMEQKPSMFASIFGSSKEFGQQMASTIMSTIQGGGNVVEAASGMVGTKIGVAHRGVAEDKREQAISGCARRRLRIDTASHRLAHRATRRRALEQVVRHGRP
jgi:hypothetical protein